MPDPVGGQRVENGQRGTIAATDPDTGRLAVRLDHDDRHVTLDAEQLDATRLGYATHVVREQGATVTHAVVVTGGWQTSQEAAYVEATRATHGTDWHIARDDLDGDTDPDRLDQLAERMSASRAQHPSLDHDIAEPLPDPSRTPDDPRGELHVARLTPSIDPTPDLTPNRGVELSR